MSENFWATQDAAIAMGHAGKAVGRRQGQEEGYQDGLADGFARGRKYGQDEGVAAMQAQLEALQQQRNALQELSNGLVMALGAAVDVLKEGSTNDKVRFARSYTNRVDQAIRKGQLRHAPHLDPNFAKLMAISAAFINDALETTLRVHDNEISP